MAKEKENLAEAMDAQKEINDVIKQHILELKEKKHLKRVFAIVVEGDEADDKPRYIGYFQNPSIMHFSAYMSFVSKDAVQAALTLARQTFLDGDRELIEDDDIFLRGTFSSFTDIMEQRQSNLVKA